MAKYTLVFVGGYTKIDGVIETASNALQENISHVASVFNGNTLEAQGVILGDEKYPGFWRQRPDRLVGVPCVRFVAVEVPDLTPILSEVQELIGTPYGYTDCIRGGVYDLFGVQIPDNALTMDCSEAQTRLLRTVVDVLPGREPGTITPIDLYRYVMEELHGEDITGLVKTSDSIPGYDFGLPTGA